jgi:AraC-like DNA-binding protein
MEKFVHIESIAAMYEMLGEGSPQHPLITVIRQWPKTQFDYSDVKFTSELYYMGLKGKINGAFKYGRSSYDYQEGTMVFMAPGQVATFSPQRVEQESNGWTVLFHPDLIRRSPLGKAINDFSFFSYDLSEALHVSEAERQFLDALLGKIELEISQNYDRHSQDLIINHLDTILKYCHRYYDRQFYTRTNLNKDLVTRFTAYLEGFFAAGNEQKIPTVTQCGEALHVSGPYLSDMLKVETGRSAKDHIHAHIIDRAKNALLNSNQSVGEIAYGLGFDYPQHFSKLFKSKTGMSPSEYRNLN